MAQYAYPTLQGGGLGTFSSDPASLTPSRNSRMLSTNPDGTAPAASATTQVLTLAVLTAPAWLMYLLTR